MQVSKNPGMRLITGQKGQAMISFSAVNNGRNVQDWSPYSVIILPPASETAHPECLGAVENMFPLRQFIKRITITIL